MTTKFCLRLSLSFLFLSLPQAYGAEHFDKCPKLAGHYKNCQPDSYSTFKVVEKLEGNIKIYRFKSSKLFNADTIQDTIRADGKEHVTFRNSKLGYQDAYQAICDREGSLQIRFMKQPLPGATSLFYHDPNRDNLTTYRKRQDGDLEFQFIGGCPANAGCRIPPPISCRVSK